MDTRLKEIVDNFEKMKIGVDEPFKFHCTMCGNYDTEQEFLPQFEDNAQKVFKFLAMVEEGGEDE